MGGSNNFGGLPLTAAASENPYVGKFDENGNAVWLNIYDYSTTNGSYDYPFGFFKDAEDNTYEDGTINSDDSTFVEKYNSSGVLQWALPLVGNIALTLHGIVADATGNIYVSGYLEPGTVTLGSTTLSYFGSGSAVVVAKLNSSGNFLWAEQFDGTGNNDGVNSGRGITIDSHGDIYVAGGYSGSPTFGAFTAPLTTGLASLFIAKINPSGAVLSLTTAIGGGFADYDCCAGLAITVDSCDNLYLAGNFEGQSQFGDFVLNSYGGTDAYIAKLDHDGTWDWAQDFGGTGNDYAGGIALDKYTDVYVSFTYLNGAATLEGSNVSGGDIAIAKLDNGKGYVDWIQTGGSTSGTIQIDGLAVDNKGYVYVLGDFEGTSTFGATTLNNGGLPYTDFLAKLDTLNHISITPQPDSFYCAGRTYTLPYTITGTFSSGNIFTAQLSNASGSFATPVDIGSFYSTSNGTITIPPSTPYGTHYRIRILSTLPPLITTIPSSNCIERHVDTTYFYITIYPIPSLVITGNNSVCPGDTTTLSTYGADHYLWNNGDTTSSITVSPSVTTTYTVQLTNGPCIYNDTTTVYINPLPIITVKPPSALVCSGRGLSLSANGASTYKWSPSHGLNATTGSAVYAGPDSATTYTVFGTDSAGCTGKTTVTVDVAALPTASFNATVPSPCTPQQLQFTNTTIGDSLTYLWQFGDGTTSTGENPLHTYSSTGKFKVTLVVTTPRGCVDSVSTEETVTSVEFVLIPNSFTPSMEGLNRFFKPNVLCSTVSGYVFRVYNRWGMQLYETNDATAPGWDGAYNGQPQPLGTYVYYMQMTCGTCSVFKKGNVTLIR